MGQIKNIKLHIVTDIKSRSHESVEETELITMLCNNTTFVMPGASFIKINVAVSVVITFLTIFTNLMLIIVFICHREVRNITNAAISLLALSDFTQGCVVMAPKIYNQLKFIGSTKTPVIDETVCMLTALGRAFTTLFSSLVLALIAVRRYLLIKQWNSRNSGVSNSKVAYVVTVLFLILICGVISILPLKKNKIGVYHYTQSHGGCFVDWCPDNNEFRTIYYTASMGIIWPVLTIFYVKLFVVYRKYQTVLKEQRLNSDRISSRSNSGFDGSFGCEKSNAVERQRKLLLDDYDQPFGVEKQDEQDVRTEQKSLANARISKQDQRVTVLVIITFLVYCICWLPITIVTIIAIDNFESIPIEWFYVIITILEMMSAIDPILYGLGNRIYWKAFMDIICK